MYKKYVKIINRQLTVKFRFLQNLDLPDENIMKRVNGLAGLLNVSAKCIWDSGKRKQSKPLRHKFEPFNWSMFNRIKDDLLI